MKKAVFYVHGQAGNAGEARHYQQLFPDHEVIGFDYQSRTPWEAISEFSEFFDKARAEFSSIVLVANSIGAFFSMNALSGKPIEKAYFISPIVDMEKLITDMMKWAGVSEQDLKKKGTIETSFGESLSWDYLSWIRNNPPSWKTPTFILYGSSDHLQSIDTIEEFAVRIGADLTVMEKGEHWFHTEEQMAFLDEWISKNR